MNERLLNPVIEQSKIVHTACKIIDRISIKNLEVGGIENLYVVRELLREGLNVIIFPNHLGHADGPMIHKSMRENGFQDLAARLCFIVGSMLMKNKMEWILTHGYRGILMAAGRDEEIDDELRAIMVGNGIAEAKKEVNGGNLLTVFAEGRRSTTGGMIEVNDGVALYLSFSSSEKMFVLPVGLVGDEIWPRDNRFPQYAKDGVVNYGQPFSVESLYSEIDGDGQVDDQVVMDAIMFKIAQLLPEEYRGYYSLISPANP